MTEISKTSDGSPTKVSPHRALSEFYPAEAQRARFVIDLFNRAAVDYNWISGALSFGTDRFYRRHALTSAGLKPGMAVLDVATGTGLLAQAALELGIAADRLIGLDPSGGMLAENRKRNSIRLVQGLGETLPFRDATFDFIAMGYALRHVEDLGRLFAEFHRVSRERGTVLILEITRPSSRLAFGLMRFYMKTLLPLLTRLRARHRDSARLMEYYWATIVECVPPVSIVSALSGAGFELVERKSSARILSDYRAVKA